MARALVLGSTGHIGAHIVRALLAKNHTVRAAFRREAYLSVLRDLPVERVRVDLETLEGLSKALKDCEWVFHAAGFYPRGRIRREAAIRKGIDSTRRILSEIQKARPSRVVFTSSAATIRQVPGRLANEEDAESWPTTTWRPLYATVKVAMEHEVLRACQKGLPVVVVNPSICLGEFDAHTFSGLAILSFAKYRIPFTIHHPLNAVYTADVGLGHVQAAECGRIGQRYLLANQNLNVPELAAIISRLAGVPGPRWHLSEPVVLFGAWIMEGIGFLTASEPLFPRKAVYAARVGQRLDSSKAQRELSLKLTPIEEAIRRALAWFRQNGYL